jgi:hypothetical protein
MFRYKVIAPTGAYIELASRLAPAAGVPLSIPVPLKYRTTGDSIYAHLSYGGAEEETPEWGHALWAEYEYQTISDSAPEPAVPGALMHAISAFLRDEGLSSPGEEVWEQEVEIVLLLVVRGKEGE